MRIIAHLDMDAFFAAVEERDDERLRGLPVVVGADPAGGRGRGVVSTANYQARDYGIHSAMPISTAWRLAEAARLRGRTPAVFLPVNGERYAHVSRRIMALVREFLAARCGKAEPQKNPSLILRSWNKCQAGVPAFERASVDEAYMDISIYGHAPCGAAAKKGVPLDVAINLVLRAKEYTQHVIQTTPDRAAMVGSVPIVCLFHVDWGNGRENTYWLNEDALLIFKERQESLWRAILSGIA